MTEHISLTSVLSKSTEFMNFFDLDHRRYAAYHARLVRKGPPRNALKAEQGDQGRQGCAQS